MTQKTENSSIILDFCDVLKLALWRPYEGPLYLKDEKELQSAMTQVRQYIISFLLPQIINKMDAQLTPQLSLVFMNLVNKAGEIEAHMRDYRKDKITHYQKV